MHRTSYKLHQKSDLAILIGNGFTRNLDIPNCVLFTQLASKNISKYLNERQTNKFVFLFFFSFDLFLVRV